MNYRRKISLFCMLVASALLLGNCAPQTTSGGKETQVITTTDEIGTGGGTIEITSGSGVTIPPGTLAVNSQVTVATVDAPAEFDVDGVVAASKPMEVIVRDSDGNPLDSVPSPLTVNLSIDPQSALALSESLSENLCVLLKSRDSRLLVWRRSAIVVDDAQARASIQTLFFGVFHLVYCGQTELPGFVDAATTGATGEAEPVTVLIPSSLPSFGHTDVCAGIVRVDGNECNSQTCEDDFRLAIMGWAGAKTLTNGDQKLTFNVAPSTFEADKSYYLAFAFTASGQCPLQHSTLTTASTETVAAMFAYQIDKAQVTAGLAATLGTAPFALTNTSVILGAENGEVMADAVPMPLCIESGTDTVRTWISTKIQPDGTLDGDMEQDFLMAAPAGSVAKNEVMVRVGSSCRGIIGSEFVSDPLTGLAYAIEYEMDVGSSIYLAPIALTLDQTKFALFATQNGCLRVYEDGDLSATDAKPVAQTVLHLGTESFSLLLPYMTNSAGEPVYDMSIGVLPAGSASCADKADTTFPVNSRPLTAEIVVPDL